MAIDFDKVKINGGENLPKDRDESISDSRDSRAENERLISEHSDFDRIIGEGDPGFLHQQVTYVPAEYKDPALYYFWALNTPGRIRELMRKGYKTIPPQEGINGEGDADAIIRTASIRGAEQKLILMACPVELKRARDFAKKKIRDQEALAMLNLHKKNPNLFVPKGQVNKVGGIIDPTQGQGYQGDGRVILSFQ